MRAAWKIGDLLTHRHNEELGAGRITAIEGNTLVVRFGAKGVTLRMVADGDVLERYDIAPGCRAKLAPALETVEVDAVLPGIAILTDRRQVPLADLWPVEAARSPVDLLASGDVGPAHDFGERLEAAKLAMARQAGGLGSFLGGRIQLFAHQLHAAERACKADPVRWLLADEVGLGKTIEACLILNRLLRTGRAERTLVVAPETLTVQWLGELWRKYHQVFVLLDKRRLADVERELGKGFNPFDTYRKVIVGSDMLAGNPKLTQLAVAAGIDLLIVDEAHHLKRPEGHPGNALYRAIAPIAALRRHVIFCSATPLEEDAHGFFRQLQLLPARGAAGGHVVRRAPGRARAAASVHERDAARRHRRTPPRVPTAITIDADPGWEAVLGLEDAVRAEPAQNAAQAQKKADRLQRALASGAALHAVLPSRDERTVLARTAMQSDPRVTWLAREARSWKARGEKSLVFVAHRETLEELQIALRREHVLAGVFHEDMSPAQRDIEVAQLRLPDGPSILIATECGGEGRNFQFCRRLVLFDLPWNPMAVEQRIGRLDRIGRRVPVEVLYFVPPRGLGAAIARFYEEIGLFGAPLGGLERELAHVEAKIRETALSGSATIEPHAFTALVDEAREANDRVQAAAHHELHRDPYRPEMEAAILSRVPAELDALNQRVVLRACDRLGLHVEKQRGRAVWSFELGNLALIDGLPGVPEGRGFLGTFDRAEAVDNESLDFYGAGHPLVEGILSELEDSPRGRVAAVQVESGEPGFGIVAILETPSGPEVAAIDADGRDRPDWVESLLSHPRDLEPLAVESVPSGQGWEALVRDLAAPLPGRGRIAAIAAIRRDVRVLEMSGRPDRRASHPARRNRRA
ncbi:MAG: helicase-related protein [Acidobacteriota bacterium]